MAEKKTLESLLQYTTSLQGQSQTQSNGGDSASRAAAGAASKSKLDPSIIDSLMGPSDGQLMLETMSAIDGPALDGEGELEALETAFDNFQLLVEQIDNAKNLKPMKLWPPLLAQLSRPQAVRREMASACIASALQNNPDAQAFFLTLDAPAGAAAGDGTVPVLEKLRSLVVDHAEPAGVRRKALFAMTAAVRNSSAGLKAFGAADGWRMLLDILTRPSDAGDVEAAALGAQLQKRSVFFLTTVFAQLNDIGLEPSEHLLQLDQGLEHTLVQVRTEAVAAMIDLLERREVLEDEDLTEKVAQALEAALRADSDARIVASKDKARLQTATKEIRQRYGDDVCDWAVLDHASGASTSA